MKKISVKETILKACQDKSGSFVIFQKPNAPLYVWIVSTLLLQINQFEDNRLLRGVAFSSIVIWSLLEIFKGDSLFRRVLGLIVLVIVLSGVAATWL